MQSEENKKENEETNKDLPGYPLYPESEDIFSKGKKEETIDPEDVTKEKAPVDLTAGRNEKDFDDMLTGDDLDVPGAELDDESEETGSEDEENNYYSLGDNE
jgi:hypothetical protein